MPTEQTKHPVVCVDIDAALAATVKSGLGDAICGEIRAYVEALQQEMKSANFAAASYRVVIEAVPPGESPNLNPLIEYRPGT